MLAGPVKALASVPAYHAAAMDGIAVKASDTFGALPEKPVILSRDAGNMVDTGDPLPDGKDAVVMIEQVEETQQGWEIREAAYPWRNVRKAGEDIVKGEIILPARHRVRPYDQAALLAAGILSIEVFQKAARSDHPHRRRNRPPGRRPVAPAERRAARSERADARVAGRGVRRGGGNTSSPCRMSSAN